MKGVQTSIVLEVHREEFGIGAFARTLLELPPRAVGVAAVVRKDGGREVRVRVRVVEAGHADRGRRARGTERRGLLLPRAEAREEHARLAGRGGGGREPRVGELQQVREGERVNVPLLLVR
jgi:hypothetical protein